MPLRAAVNPNRLAATISHTASTLRHIFCFSRFLPNLKKTTHTQFRFPRFRGRKVSLVVGFGSTGVCTALFIGAKKIAQHDCRWDRHARTHERTHTRTSSSTRVRSDTGGVGRGITTAKCVRCALAGSADSEGFPCWVVVCWCCWIRY